LPTTICQLNALQDLNLSKCSSLQELPPSIGLFKGTWKTCFISIRQLSALQTLDLQECSNLRKLPTSIGQLNAFKEFHLQKCLNLEELPTSIGQLNTLRQIDWSNLLVGFLASMASTTSWDASLYTWNSNS